MPEVRKTVKGRGRGDGDGEVKWHKMREFFKRLKLWAYPECDHLNIALRFLLKNPEQNKIAIEEIYFALMKTNGYFYDDVAKSLYEEFKLSCRW